MLEPRKQDVEYYPDHNGSFFYIRVNDTGRNFRLVKAPVTDPRSANWQEVVPHRANVMLDDTDFFKNYYVLSERENGLPQMQVTDLATGKSRRIEFPEPAYASYPYANREYDTTKFRYGYQSFITPHSVFEYDMATGKSTLLKQKEVPGGYDRTKYQVEQIYAPRIRWRKNAHLGGAPEGRKTGWDRADVSDRLRFLWLSHRHLLQL